MPARRTIRVKRRDYRLSEAVTAAMRRKARLLGISESLLAEKLLRQGLNLPEFEEGEYD